MVADIFSENFVGPEFDPRKLNFRILMHGIGQPHQPQTICAIFS